jgi:hypothetical protein
MAGRHLWISVALAVAFLAAPLRAGAASHLWRFEEFFSTADRKVQYIEMREIGGSEIETNISEHWYATTGYNQDHSQLLGYDLPFGTANKRFLVGTQSYAVKAAQEDLPAPDYILPDGFFDPAGDTIVWWFYQTLTIPPDTMPSNGTHSLHLKNPANPSLGFKTGPNSPTNFAGETGTLGGAIPIPATSPWGIVSSVALLLLATWAIALRSHRLRRGRSARYSGSASSACPS